MTAQELLQQKPLFEKYLCDSKSNLSAYSFVNLLAWCDFFDFQFKEIEGNLCVFAQDRAGTFLYLKPLGKNISSRAVDYAFEKMKKINGNSRLSRIENVDEENVSLFSNSKFEIQLKSHEYCYYREDITQLKGNAYKSQRAAFNQFTKNYKFEYLPYTESMKEDCLKLFRSWKSQKETKVQEEIARFMLEDNEKVHANVLTHAAKLNLIGRVVKIDDVVKAYTFGYEIHQEMFCVLFEITDRLVKGISSFTFSRFCQDSELMKYKFINVMDDFGLNQVNQTKMAYNPVALLPSYTVLQTS